MSWFRVGGIRDKTPYNIFVKNLHEDVKSKDLNEFFSTFGKIFSCKASYNKAGKCKGYGYVQYESKEDADKVLKEANGKTFKGTTIEVCLFKPRDTRMSSINSYNNLFVKCIPKKFTNEDLKKLFEPYGEIISAVVMKETAESKENKGFGFVCFKNIENTKGAEEKMKKFEIEGQILFVTKAITKEEHKKQLREERLKTFKDCNLYVKELPDDVNDEKLKKAFIEFGNVISTRVMLEKKIDPTTGKLEYKSRNFGFVCFSNKEEAKKAISSIPSKEIFGRILYVNIAEKKEERLAKAARGLFLPYPPQFPMGMYGMPPPFFQYPYTRQPRPRHVDFFLYFFRKAEIDL